MTILVTGGAGFIGANFVLDWSRESDERVVILDKLTYAGNRENLTGQDGVSLLEFVRGDIADAALVEDLLGRHRPRAVLNFAAETHVDRSIHGPRVFIETNVVGTFVLLQAVRGYLDGAGAGPDFRFLHVSTDEVYGSLAPDAPGFTEDHPYRPNSPYAASKAGSDHLVRAYHQTYGLPTLITNGSNTYGPFQFPEKLIPLMIHNALAGRALPVYGDGLQVRDWLYVGDHCAAIRAVLAGGTPGRVYNIGGDGEKANIEVVRAICRLLDVERPRADGRGHADQIAFVNDRPGHDRRYAIDAGRIKAGLGWRPLTSFESGLARTVRWYLDNRSWVDSMTSGVTRDPVDRSDP